MSINGKVFLVAGISKLVSWSSVRIAIANVFLSVQIPEKNHTPLILFNFILSNPVWLIVLKKAPIPDINIC